MDSLDQVKQLDCESNQKWAVFQKRLEPFPHFFNMADRELVHINTLRDVKNHLEASLQAGFKIKFETAHALDLVAYAQFNLGQQNEALENTDRALVVEGQETSLVSLANKAVILWNMGRHHEADECIATLQKLHTDEVKFDYLVVKARAEVAACYTRFGPRFARKAMGIYEEVIPEGREPEVWAWKYGHALKLRQSLNLQHTPIVGGEDIKKKHLTVLRLFQDIIQNCQCQNSKAKAYVETALLLDGLLDQDTRNALQAETKLTPLEACEKALQLDNDDASILTKVANVYRHVRDYTRARQLLEKANEKQPTSRGYHYLGLTLKAIASKTKENLESPASSPKENSGENGHLKEGEDHDVCTYTPKEAQESERRSGQVKADGMKKECPDGAHFLLPEHARGTADNLTKCLVARVKSFPQGACSTEFFRNDEYVEDTMKYLTLAVEFSSRMNTRAMYDLSMMHKALREFDSALALLEEICGKHFSPPLDLVTAYEQRGLIMKAMSDREDDEEKKRRLESEAERMLNTALSKASRLFSRTPQVRDRLGDIFHSFSTLLKSVEESSRCPRDKLREKAKLFWLIKNHKESLSLLQEIVQMAPEQQSDPEHLKLQIQNLVEDRRYSEALAFIELLQCTQQAELTFQLFDDHHYVTKVYMEAARDALLQGKSAKHFFHTAFSDTFTYTQNSGSSCSESSDDNENDVSDVQDHMDIIILHDDDTEEKAGKLSDILREVCGLTVTRMDENIPLGKLRMDGVLKVMKLSRLVVVITGHKKRISRELQLYISHAAKRSSTVTLQAGSGRVPSLLGTHRALSCPSVLWEIILGNPDGLKKTEVPVICSVFGFLAGVTPSFGSEM